MSHKQTPPPISMLAMQDAPTELMHDFHPKKFTEYLGQEALKQKLHIYITAALMRKEPLDHLLLFGPPGLGKTTLAQIIAQELGVEIKICSGPALERTGDLVAILTNLQPKDVLFIDEIHRLSITVEETLYSAMEQFRVDIIIGQGAGAQSINLPLNPFTLIGATTRTGLLSAPLRSRFGIIERLELYTPEELTAIVQQSASFLKLKFTQEAALLVAKGARGTPRIAKKMVRRVRDILQVQKHAVADHHVVAQALDFLGIDSQGLTKLDRTLLSLLAEQFNGGPVGLDTLAALLHEDSQTIEEVYEPYLMQKGLLEKTARGRQIPAKMLPLIKRTSLGQTSIFKEE